MTNTTLVNGTIHVWNRKQQQFTHNFNVSYDKIDSLNLLSDYTLIFSVNNYLTRWSISHTKTVVYTTKWQSFFQSKFRKKNQQWILEANLDFSPKTTARCVFGYSIADNLSTKQISAIKYIFP